MPVHHLDFFLAEIRVIHNDKLSSIEGIRLGIDAQYWLRRIVGREAYHTMMGGAPWDFRAHIEKEINILKKLKITPVFVFPGLSLCVKGSKPKFPNDKERMEKREAAWNLYENGEVDKALNLFSSTSNGQSNEMMMQHLMLILRELNVEFMRAPYSSLAQLAYFASSEINYVHLVFAPSDILLYQVERVIIALDCDKDVCNWVDKEQLLHEIQLDEDQFLDFCLLAGYEDCPTFPPFAETPGSFNIKSVFEIFKQYGSGSYIISSYYDHPKVKEINYGDIFARSKCYVKHHLIMDENAIVQPLDMDTSPSDLHEIIGSQLPQVVYFLLSLGYLSPHTINGLLSGNFMEYRPLCGGNTKEYKNFLRDHIATYTQTLNYLTHTLHGYFRNSKVNVSYWFDYEHKLKVPLEHNFSPSLYESLNWIVPHDFRHFIHQLNQNKTDLFACLRFLRISPESGYRTRGLLSNSPLTTKDEVLASIFWRFLELRNFIDTEHILTFNGTALSTLETLHQEEILLAVELMKSKLLHGRPFSNEILELESKEDVYIRLISRACCLLHPISKLDSQWNGKVDRYLLPFVSCINSLKSSFRGLMDAILVSLAYHDHLELTPTQFHDILTSMPFSIQSSSALGCLCSRFLQLYKLESGPKIFKTLSSEYTGWGNVAMDLKVCMEFFDQVTAVVKFIYQNFRGIPEAVYNEFSEANDWLQGPKKLLLNI